MCIIYLLHYIVFPPEHPMFPMVKVFWLWKTGLNLEINPGFMACLGMTAFNLFMSHLLFIFILFSFYLWQGFSTSELWRFCMVLHLTVGSESLI